MTKKRRVMVQTNKMTLKKGIEWSYTRIRSLLRTAVDGYKRSRRTNIIYGSVLRYLTCDQWSHHDWPPVGIEVSPLPIGDLYVYDICPPSPLISIQCCSQYRLPYMICVLLLLLCPSNAVLNNDLIRVYDHSIPFFNVILLVWTIFLLFFCHFS